ncbi:MAG: hypothetical protein AAF660_08695 [Pseudomonadota bacterium]
MNALTDILLIEWLGYAASALVLLSLSMSSIARLRWFNLAGALTFTVYGYAIEAWPVAAVNFAISIINVYYLAQHYTQRDFFKTREINADDSYLKEFLDFHRDLVTRWYPQFTGTLPDDALVLLSLRNMAVAGVFAGQKTGKSTLKILIEFVIPQYADKKVGRFLYRDNRQVFLEQGINKLVVDTGEIDNESYFRSMGFRDSKVYGRDQLVLDLDTPRTT